MTGERNGQLEAEEERGEEVEKKGEERKGECKKGERMMRAELPVSTGVS